MQPASQEHFPLKIDVLVIGHRHDEASNVEHFHKFTYEANETVDDKNIILSGKLFFFLVPSLSLFLAYIYIYLFSSPFLLYNICDYIHRKMF